MQQSSPANAFASGVAITDDHLVAVGTPVGAESLTGWFGSAKVTPSR